MLQEARALPQMLSCAWLLRYGLLSKLCFVIKT